MTANLHGLVTHLRIRLIWTLRSPVGLTMMVLFSIGALFYWPGADPLMLEVESPAYSAMLWVLWLWLWPAIPAVYAAGRASGGRATSTRLRALPALPVGSRSRALAEATLVLAIVAVVRTASSFALPDADSGAYAVDTAVGCLLMLSPLIAWAAPAHNLNEYMFRPLAVAVALLVPALIGFTNTLAGVAATCLAMAVLLLATLSIELRLPQIREPVPKRSERFRPGIDPLRRLARDSWQLVLDRWGLPFALLTAVVAVVLALDVRQLAPPYALLVSSWAPLVLVISVGLRPFDSKLIALGLTGRFGVSPGDFIRAWSVLPVRREAVLRRVYLHGLMFGGLAWGGAAGLILVRTWARFGVPGLRAADGGNLVELVVPFAAAAPCLAGVLTAAAVGDRLRTVISGVGILMVFHGHPMILIALTSTLGRDSSTVHILHALVMVVVAIVGGLPPLVHLRKTASVE